MRLYISNAFSLSMLDRESQNGTPLGYFPRPIDSMTVARIPRPVDDPISHLQKWEEVGADIVSVVGHADTARVISSLLGRKLPLNRVSIRLAHDEYLLVGQYIGPRLPEGATELPEGATIEWWIL